VYVLGFDIYFTHFCRDFTLEGTQKAGGAELHKAARSSGAVAHANLTLGSWFDPSVAVIDAKEI
jgi:hypothetical protein